MVYSLLGVYMANYAILRTAKLKTVGNIGGSLAHNYRTRETHNADPSRLHLNHHTVSGGPSEVLAKIKAKLPEKRRKDAVLCIEYMIGSSPDGLKTDEDHKAYLTDALRWLKERHGADNVIAATVHMDETTPHLAAYVVPLDEQGKLNAKKFLGGRQTLSAMQTDFAKKVGEKHGLERGIERSTAKHTTIKEWYGLLNESAAPVEIPASAVKPKVKEKRLLLPDIVETPDEVARRLNRNLDRLMEPTLVKAKMSDFERKKADEIRALVKDTQRQLQAAEERAKQAERQAQGLRNVYESLTPTQQKSIVEQAKRNVNVRNRCKKILSDAYDNVTGPVARFAIRAKKALGEVKGRWWEVNWSTIERAFSTAEIEYTNQQQAASVLIEHSPGQANLSSAGAKKVLEVAKKNDEGRELQKLAEQEQEQVIEVEPETQQGQQQRPKG